MRIEPVLQRIYEAELPEAKDLEFLLALEDKTSAGKIFAFADKVRRQYAGDGILLRGIIEFSSFCRNNCFYCGLNRNNVNLPRYRMDSRQIMECVARIAESGIKTVVLQSGEDESVEAEWLKDIILEIKSGYDMAVTLSVGERDIEDYRSWKYAGCDRYLLKIETRDKALYESLHPGMSFENRLKCLKNLAALGYQTGCGNIIGLKGQSIKSIAGDILFFKQENFDMIGIGPFIPHPGTALAKENTGGLDLTLKALALTRIVTKSAHLPATTALGSIGDKDSRMEGLKCGANVLMLNFTPDNYRKLYEIYPGKRCVNEHESFYKGYLKDVAAVCGRSLDYSRGDTLQICVERRK
ncbi:MAG: [FeFe] hydrogenase H-cluster radical SAM maturase HydE [Candidatus Omnitrophica bacterium]|nr:[FeFe] hydrogenase H-cluster radical SAM maturase HydE [Candidatus Omnitrophota bacterium]